MTDNFYRAFEDRYRGSRETIKERLRAYLPFIAPLVSEAEKPAALDLGCGRGEWLELLGEHGFAARGVDLDDGMLGACRERGLSVETGDALDALRALPDGSVDIVSAFHLVEHIAFDALCELVNQALRVLRPGGLLIMETPNPENPMVGACRFYLDPSHLKPLPPNLLSFVVEHGGFARQKVVRLQEDAALHTAPAIRLINVLDGASPDYSVVGQKAAGAEMLERFDDAFGRKFGIGIDELAQRFEESLQDASETNAQFAETRESISKLEAMLGNVNAALAQTARESDLRIAELRAEFTANLDDTKAYLNTKEQELVSLRAHLDAVFASTSWRVTAPLRWLGSLFRSKR